MEIPPAIVPMDAPRQEAALLNIDLSDSLSTQWYFAEGATHPIFETYYLLANPNPQPMTVDLLLYPEDGDVVSFPVEIEANARKTLRLNGMIEETGVSGLVRSQDGKVFAAERATYIRGADGRFIGAHAAPGIAALASSWWLVEGATSAAGPTGTSFDTFILALNPHDQPDTLLLTFSRENEPPFNVELPISANRRLTIHANTLDERLANRSFSTAVGTQSGRGIVVEQAMWWGHVDRPGSAFVEGNAAPGLPLLSRNWHFAAGDTFLHDEFILLLNPHSTETDVQLTYLLETNPPVQRSLTLLPHQRRTIDVRNDNAGLGVQALHGTMINATNIIGAQRSMYYRGEEALWMSGHTSNGTPALAQTWLLAEGADLPFSDSRLRTEIQIVNPLPDPAEVLVSFISQSGIPAAQKTLLLASGRLTIRTGTVDWPIQGSFGTLVQSTSPIVVERSMFFGIGPPNFLPTIGSTGSTAFPIGTIFPKDADARVTIPSSGIPNSLVIPPSATPTPTLTPTPLP